MNRYNDKRREAVIAKMTGPNRKSIAELARQEQISEATLYKWRDLARGAGAVLPDADESPAGWSTRDKFNAVLATASLSQQELSEYCRRNGLYPEQISRWREACEAANDMRESSLREFQRQRRVDRMKLQELEREVRRKDKALAETAALLVLQKKLQAIWGDKEDA